MLQRFLYFKDAANKKKLSEYDEAIADSHSQTSKVEKTDEAIVESVPKMYLSKASKLLGELREAGTVKCDNKQLFIDGALVQGNIVDLVNDAMRSRKGNLPRGYSQLTTAPRTGCIPLEYIGNQQV